jgi:type I restriction enzyme S subunit
MKKGWELKKLGEIVKIINGRNQKEVLSENGKYPIYGSAGNLMGLATDYLCEAGTTIIGRKGNISNPIYISEKFWNVDTAFGLFPINDINPKFIYYLTLTIDFQSHNRGATIPSLVKSELLEICVPFTNQVNEQQRIVTILDRCFAAIDQAKAHAEQNLRNARELFESYLNAVFENKGEGWEERRLKEITSKIGSGATPKGGQESYKSEGISLVRSMNVHDWEFRDKNLAFIDEKQAKELNGVTLQEGDVLLNITGASVARSCLFPKEFLPARVNQHVSIIRCKKDIVDSKFLNLLLTSKIYKDQLLFTGEQGATRQAITKAQIEAFHVSIPLLSEQQSIVHKLDALRAETQRLEVVYKKKIQDLEELRKSVLEKAFRGELSESRIATD